MNEGVFNFMQCEIHTSVVHSNLKKIANWWRKQTGLVTERLYPNTKSRQEIKIIYNSVKKMLIMDVFLEIVESEMSGKDSQQQKSMEKTN